MGLAIFTATAGLFAGPNDSVLTPSSILHSKGEALVLYAIFMSFAVRFYLGTSFSFESFSDRSRRRRLFFLNYTGEMIEAAIFVGMGLGLNYSATAFFSWLTALVFLGVFDNLFVWLYPDIRSLSPNSRLAVLRTLLWPYPPAYDGLRVLDAGDASMYRASERIHAYRTHRYWVHADIAECSILLFSQPLLFHSVSGGTLAILLIVVFLVLLTIIDTVVDTWLISQFEEFPYSES